MGLFYTNLTIYRSDRPSLLTTLRRLRRTAFVGPTAWGHTTVYDRAMEDQDFDAIERFGQAVTGGLGCSALAAVLHDDGVLYLWLFRGGDTVDCYDSSPAYFHPTADHAPPVGGDAGLICAAFDRPDRRGRVGQLLRADLLADEPPGIPGEQGRHAALAAELGLPPEVGHLGYEAIAGGHIPDEFRGVPFESIGPTPR